MSDLTTAPAAQAPAAPTKQSITEFNANLETMIDEKTQEWAERLRDLFPRLKGGPESIVDIQAEALSYRQMLSEEISFWGKQYSNEQKRLKKLRKERFLYYSTGQLPEGAKRPALFVDSPMVQLKTTKGEKDLVIAGDLSEYERSADLYQNIIDYLGECRKNIDHCLYGVRNRIELLKVLML